MEEEFYASIKLTSGEEIVAKVSYDPDDDVIVVLDPRVVEKVEAKKKNMLVEGIVFDDWMNATYENMFIIPRSQIITMTELDERIEKCYSDHLKNKMLYKKSRYTAESKTFNSKRQNPRNHEGYLGSIKEAKSFLEEIYNKS
jgi:hypothetical protein